jgi:uncharacterized protein
MVTRSTAWLPGTPCWVDLSVDDGEKAAAFYNGLFGWDVAVDPDPQFGGHGNFSLNGKSVAGVSPTMEPGQPQVWATYLATDDIERSKEKVTAAGGQLLTDVIDIGGHGRMLVAMDLAGAVFGLWQSGTHTGYQLANEAGSITWNENMSNDVEANKKFYADVCGASFSDLGGDDHVYATMDIDGRAVAGMTTLPSPDAPPHWLVYFAVADTDAAVAKLTALDGKVLAEAFDTPQGRIAIVTDNQGAPFGLISVQPED